MTEASCTTVQSEETWTRYESTMNMKTDWNLKCDVIFLVCFLMLHFSSCRLRCRWQWKSWLGEWRRPSSLTDDLMVFDGIMYTSIWIANSLLVFSCANYACTRMHEWYRMIVQETMCQYVPNYLEFFLGAAKSLEMFKCSTMRLEATRSRRFKSQAMKFEMHPALQTLCISWYDTAIQYDWCFFMQSMLLSMALNVSQNA